MSREKSGTRWQDAHTPWEGCDRDRFAGESAVVRFQGTGLVDEGLPGEGGCPWDGEDLAGEDAGGIDGLAELPIGEMGGTAKGIEIRLGAFGGLVAMSLGPRLCPADIIGVGGGLGVVSPLDVMERG